MRSRSRFALAAGVLVIALCAAALASGQTQDELAKATSASKGLNLKASIKKKAKYGESKTVRARVTGSSSQLRGTKVELRVRGPKGYRVEDRAKGRAGKPLKLKWKPRGLGLVRVQVALVRGKNVLAKRKKKVFVVHPVRVLDPTQIAAVPPPGQPGSVAYAGPEKLTVGDILAAGVGPATPYGFLGVVVHKESGQTVSTEPTTLLHAVAQGSIDVSQTYAPRSVAALSSSARRKGVAGATIPVRAAVQCTSGAKIQVSGTATVKPGIEFEADWGFFKLDSARMEAVVRMDADLSASAEARASCTAGPTEIARYPLAPITFTVGPVPVVISPQVVITLKADGTVSARTSAGIHGSIEGRGGIQYDHGFSPIGSFTPSFDYSPPALSAQGHLGATVTPALEMLLYGVGGPRVFLETGLSIDAQANADPWWTLAAPIRVGANLTIPALKLHSGDLTVYENKIVLAQADTPPAPPEHRAAITWDTNGSDVDLHIWDKFGNHAWYGEQDGIPDATLSTDITDGFGPEVFSDQRVPTGRKFTYGICYYDDHDAGPTTVSVDLTDPDGTIRSSAHTLFNDKDFVLVGSSPSGGGYVPPTGWCD